MASKYLKWKARNEKPNPPPKPLTTKEKLLNFWDYYKKPILAGAVLLVLLIYFYVEIVGLGGPKPDYQVAYVGSAQLPDETVKALEKALAAMGEDLNKDGRVVVKINQYLPATSMAGMGLGGGVDMDAASAAETTLMSDIEMCQSFIFLLEDPNSFQRKYEALSYPDGSLPASTSSANGTYLSWADCPVLTSMELGSYKRVLITGQSVTKDIQDDLNGLYIARRGFWSEKTVQYPEECEALWKALIAGAE